MKKSILLTFLIIWSFVVNAQNSFQKKISTNPENPVNNEFLLLYEQTTTSPTLSDNIMLNNGYLNFMSDPGSFTLPPFTWYPEQGDGSLGDRYALRIRLRTDLWTYYYGLDEFSLYNPFNESGPELDYLKKGHTSNRDFKWEDGWELLWVNIGSFLNGKRYEDYTDRISNYISPRNVPYYTLYNRYSGLIRLFYSFFPAGSEHEETITVEMGFTSRSTNNSLRSNHDELNGMFRHNSPALEQALDQPTDIINVATDKQVYSPVEYFSAAEFQVAYDPCVCNVEGMVENTFRINYMPASLAFRFKVNSPVRDLNMIYRGVQIDKGINNSILDKGRLMFSNRYDAPRTKTASSLMMHFSPDEMFNNYAFLEHFHDEATNIHQPYWNKKRRSFIQDNFAPLFNDPNAHPDGSELKVLLDKPDDLTIPEAMLYGKAALARSTPFLNLSYKGADNLQKANYPIANFLESAYGEQEDITPLSSVGRLKVPGVISYTPPGETRKGFPNVVNLGSRYQHSLPAYNQPLGQVAVLTTPKLKVYNKEKTVTTTPLADEKGIFPDSYGGGTVLGKVETNFDLKLSFEEIPMIAFNEVLDFDMDLTTTYVSVEVEYQTSAFLENIHDQYHHYESKLNNSQDSLMFLDAIVSNKPSMDFDADVRKHHFFTKWMTIDQFIQQEFNIDFTEKDYIDVASLRHAFQTGNFHHNNAEIFRQFPHFRWIGDLHAAPKEEPTPPFCAPCVVEEPLLEKGYIKSIRVKFMHDMYFHKKDHLGEDVAGEHVNQTQVHTIEVYNLERGIDHIGGFVKNKSEAGLEYPPGTLVLEDEHITTNSPYISEIIGNDLIIKHNSFLIKGSLTVEEGNNLIIKAYDRINTGDNMQLGDRVSLRTITNKPTFNPATPKEVYDFCNDPNGYQARYGTEEAIEKLKKIAEYEEVQKKPEVAQVELSVFPNPSNDKVYLSASEAGSYQMRLLNAQGKAVRHEQVSIGNDSQLLIDVSQLPQGIYIIELSERSGKNSGQTKIIVH